MISENEELSFYLVNVDGDLVVRRSEKAKRYPTEPTIASGLYSNKATPILENIGGPSSSTRDLLPVDDNDPIRQAYDPKQYRPPGYDNPMTRIDYRPPCLGCYDRPLPSATTPFSKQKDDKYHMY